MNRRNFVKGTTVAICALPIASAMAFSPVNKRIQNVPEWLEALVKQNDIGVEAIKKLQIKETANPAYGGLMDAFEVVNPHTTSALIQAGANAISSPGSRFFRSNELLADMNLATLYLVKTQHEDGTIDLLSTNFHSTPDTGFLVKRLVTAYTLIQKSETSGGDKMLTNLKTFLIRGGNALSVGGIHTPNHRWVVCAALAKLNSLWPDPKYVARAEQWLGEHIDIDQDGQYNEKSTFIYSSLTDRLLITIASGFNKPELLDSVRKNLDMTMFYVHPNGEIVTDASGRQDKALVGTLENYYYPYRYLALKDQNGAYAAMCQMIEKTAGLKIGGFLDYYLSDQTLWKELPAPKPLPVNYVKTFPNSGLVRIRRGNWDSTLIANNPSWLTFMKGNAVLQGVRLASSFFGKGQFQSEKLDEKGKTWELAQTLDGPYFQPYPKDFISKDGDWEKMPRLFRPVSEVQNLETRILISETENGMQIDIQTIGTERVPLAVELIFRPGGTFTGLTRIENTKDSWLLKEGTGSYSFNGDTISFGPGIGLHKNIALRGALPPVEAPTVFLTGFTPFKHTIRFS
ncbi:twin-arginine translocation signal domain-containing protein [Dyadobacter chenwenxiniae]|uniref:Twin-arginine translocation signal domain-containing protein n=1 Tax=Dyadobacter chenwenxiniae TaxID=2906456 RepID=A0A9X1PRD0_9BACT|nr:twin-arginine translocation signal domain-containing protein [Dyadobacter chenwenxiniae]MCF0063591.1 twin-arginine translocation signal domain-containing protein [Dyadobacter chenwenxiniae]UON83267.1 twin-arginine translocation signal domain-containing protein [Dyadobacter chenwenxiniae]